MGGLGPLVSSRLSFYNENPSRPISLTEIDHEISSLEEKKKFSGALAVGGGVVSLIAIAGLLGFGIYLVGALLAIAAVAAFYSYCCNAAEGELREKKGDLAITPSSPGVLPGSEKAAQQAQVLGRK